MLSKPATRIASLTVGVPLPLPQKVSGPTSPTILLHVCWRPTFTRRRPHNDRRRIDRHSSWHQRWPLLTSTRASWAIWSFPHSHVQTQSGTQVEHRLELHKWPRRFSVAGALLQETQTRGISTAPSSSSTISSVTSPDDRVVARKPLRCTLTPHTQER